MSHSEEWERLFGRQREPDPELPDPTPSLFARFCAHPRWADDGPDEMGERLCAVCEARVPVRITERALQRMFDRLRRAALTRARLPSAPCPRPSPLS